jgi:leucyl aminopeptidase (aminopeptidase T)
MIVMDPFEAARNALVHILGASYGESLLVLADDEKENIADFFITAGIELGLWTRKIILNTSKIREKVSDQIKEIILGQKASPNIYINILRSIPQEVSFRIELIHLEERGRKSRVAHCPGITLDMLTEGALALNEKEHKEIQNRSYHLLNILEGYNEIQISTPNGTKLKLSVKGRKFITDTIFNWENYKMINLPTGEVMCAPLENSMIGILVCDLAVGGIGVIKTPVLLEIENGEVKDIHSDDNKLKDNLSNLLSRDEYSKILGEFAISLNKKARITSNFLEAEKAYGTTHIAFGNNLSFPGGKNPSKSHVDLLMKDPTIIISNKEGKKKKIMENGKFI